MGGAKPLSGRVEFVVRLTYSTSVQQINMANAWSKPKPYLRTAIWNRGMCARAQISKADSKGKLSRRGVIEAKHDLRSNFPVALHQVCSSQCQILKLHATAT